MSQTDFARVASAKAIDGKVFVTVQPSRPGVRYYDIPMLRLFPGALIVPEQGDIVAVHKLEDGSRYATFASSAPQDFTMPALSEGELCFRFSDGTEIRIQNSGGGYTVDIAGDQDVTLKSGTKVIVDSPEVFLGGEAGTAPVAREGDPVSVTHPTDGTLSGQIDTGSTSVNST